MTYTRSNIDSDFSIIPDENIEAMARRIEAAAQKQVAADIARLKAMGKPIYYEMGNKLVREEPDGSKFEYRLGEDGSEEILQELH